MSALRRIQGKLTRAMEDRQRQRRRPVMNAGKKDGKQLYEKHQRVVYDPYTGRFHFIEVWVRLREGGATGERPPRT